MSTLPLMAYLLLAPTVHPWYALILMILVPFLSPAEDEPPMSWLHLLPWIYLSGALILSYTAYLDPQRFQERPWVSLVEWLPTLLLLLLSWRMAGKIGRDSFGDPLVRKRIVVSITIPELGSGPFGQD